MKELFFLAIVVLDPTPGFNFDGMIASVHVGAEDCVEQAVIVAEAIDLEKNRDVYLQCMPSLEGVASRGE